MKKWLFGLVFLTGCAGFSRDCASCSASNFGSDWIVVQFAADGHTIHCWELHDTAVESSSHQDIYWQTRGGHLVHIEGWYNRVQVQGGDFAGARREMGLTDTCISDRGTP